MLRSYFRNKKIAKYVKLEENLRSAQRHLSRLKSRRASMASHGYQTRRPGAVRTAGEKSPGGLSNSGIVRMFDHTEVRRNVRDAVYDSPHARALATRFTDNIADTGLKPKFEPDHESLGISREQAVDWGRQRSREFHRYLNSPQCMLSEDSNGYQAMWLYAFQQQRDNENYWRFHYTRDRRLMSPVQLQPLDADQLVGYGYTVTDGMQAGLNSGIGYDSRGREKAYTFLVENGKEGFKEVTIPKVGKKSGRRYVVHGFRKEYAGQKQGFSLYTHLLQHFEYLTDFELAHTQLAVNQSTHGFYIKPSKDAAASGGASDFVNEAVRPAEELLGDYADKVDNMSQTELNQLMVDVLPEAGIRQVGTTWSTWLKGGEDIGQIQHTAPADKFGEFVDSVMSYLCASTGMSIEALKMQFGQNYSASRATLVLLWRVINLWRAEMVADFLNVWAEAWLSEEIAAGRVRAPGWSDPRLKSAWLNMRWVGSSEPTIDPKKEAEGAKLRAELGSESLDDIALRYNNSDGAANRAQLTREYGELPVPPWAGAPASTGAEEDTDGEGEDEDADE